MLMSTGNNYVKCIKQKKYAKRDYFCFKVRGETVRQTAFRPVSFVQSEHIN